MTAESSIAMVAQALRGARVLLVEDCELMRDVGRTLLEDAGAVVEEAGDGTMAVTMACEGDACYSLILMDVQMPVMDGLAATRAILAKLGGRAPPIVALTAAASDRELQLCRDAGMTDHIPKPIDPDQLVDVVNRCARRPSRSGTADAGLSSHATARNTEAFDVPDVPEFDLTFGLRSANGRPDLLRSLLARFGRNHAGAVPALRELIGAGDFSEARRLAHTLKGAAATLGGTKIAHAAEVLEQALRQLMPGDSAVPARNEDVRARNSVAVGLDKLEAQLQRVLPALLKVRDAQRAALTPAAADSPRIALPLLHAAEFAQLRRLLAGNHYTARNAFAELRTKVSGNDAQWQAAAVAVDAMEFRQALAQLDQCYPSRIGAVT